MRRGSLEDGRDVDWLFEPDDARPTRRCDHVGILSCGHVSGTRNDPYEFGESWLLEKTLGLPLSALSMGERVKVKLMQFIVEGKDVLLLDEPTNHLDLPSREELEKTWETFSGTLLFASHDQYFTERIADGLLLFENETIRKLSMTFSEWKERGMIAQSEKAGVERMRLETELQAVLGNLSMLKPGDTEYVELDQAFYRLSKRLRELD